MVLQVKFESKVVLVTGSANNIGKAIALKFANQGAKVIINAKNNVDAGNGVVEEIRANGGNAIFVQADVSDPKQVDNLFQKAVAKFQTIDVLVNNAGSVTQIPFLESTKQHWLDAFNDNLFSSVLCSIEAAKIMQDKRFGRIINTASIRGLERTGRTGIMAYSSAKAALINFTKTLAKELAPYILVNAVAPGFTLTTAFDKVSEEIKNEYINGSLIKRWLTTDEIADAFLYLASADGITGEVLVVDGGWTLK
jgi:3-oxoacyl-[acyl-carrier protein] reductase